MTNDVNSSVKNSERHADNCKLHMKCRVEARPRKWTGFFDAVRKNDFIYIFKNTFTKYTIRVNVVLKTILTVKR